MTREQRSQHAEDGTRCHACCKTPWMCAAGGWCACHDLQAEALGIHSAASAARYARDLRAALGPARRAA